MFRYRLRTLLIVLALAPPVLAALALLIAAIVRDPALIFGISEVLYALACLAVPIALLVSFVVALTRLPPRRDP